MMNLSFLFRSRDNNAGYCSSPEVITGKEIDIKKFADDAVTPYYSYDNRPKAVLVTQLRTDRAYFIDTCHTKERLIEIAPDCRVFFAENNQQREYVQPFLIHLLSRKVLILTEAAPQNHEQIDYPALYSEQGEDITGQRLGVVLPVEASRLAKFPWESHDGYRTDFPRTTNGDLSRGKKRVLQFDDLLKYRSTKIYSNVRIGFQENTEGYCKKCIVVVERNFQFNQLSYEDLTSEVAGIKVNQLSNLIVGKREELHTASAEMDEKIRDYVFLKYFYDDMSLLKKILSEYIGLEKKEHKIRAPGYIDLEADIGKGIRMAQTINFDQLNTAIKSISDLLSSFIIGREKVEQAFTSSSEEPRIEAVDELVKTYIPKINSSNAVSLLKEYTNPNNDIANINSIILSVLLNEKSNESSGDAESSNTLGQKYLALFKNSGESLIATIVNLKHKIESFFNKCMDSEDEFYKELLVKK